MRVVRRLKARCSLESALPSAGRMTRSVAIREAAETTSPVSAPPGLSPPRFPTFRDAATANGYAMQRRLSSTDASSRVSTDKSMTD